MEKTRTHTLTPTMSAILYKTKSLLALRWCQWKRRCHLCWELSCDESWKLNEWIELGENEPAICKTYALSSACHKEVSVHSGFYFLVSTGKRPFRIDWIEQFVFTEIFIKDFYLQCDKLQSFLYCLFKWQGPNKHWIVQRFVLFTLSIAAQFLHWAN